MGDCTRREFQLLLAAAGLAACGSSTAAVKQSNDLVTLGFAQFPALANAGGSVVVDVEDRFPIAVVRTGDATALALSATCTHAGCVMSWNGQALHCPCHDANFSSTGAVMNGPTTIPVPVYAAAVQADAIVVNLA